MNLISQLRMAVALVLAMAMIWPAAARRGQDPLSAANDSAPADARLLATAHGEHLWFISPAKPRPNQPAGSDAFLLCHRATDLDDGVFKPLVAMPRRPEALASWNNQLWLIFPPKSGVAGSVREVFTIRVRKHEAMGIYLTEPVGYLEMLPPLSGDGELIAFTADAQGPIALLGDNRSGISLRLVQWQRDTWVDLDLPEDIRLTARSMLAVAGPDGALLSVLDQFSSNPAQSRWHERTASGQWSTQVVSLPFHAVQRMISVDGQIAAVVRHHRADEIEITYLRSSGPISLVSLPTPAGKWQITGAGFGIVLLEQTDDDQLLMRVIDQLDGQVTAAQPMSPQRLAAAQIWQMSLLMAMAATIALLLFLVRPTESVSLSLPAGVETLPLMRRVVALLIDLLPGAAVAVLLTGSHPMDLLYLPIFTIEMQQSVPYLLMAAITLVHTAIMEVFFATSIGKILIGARIADTGGGRPAVRRIALRAVMKGLVFFLPPLVLFSIMSANGRGLPDLVSGTVVVRDLTLTGERERNDR